MVQELYSTNLFLKANVSYLILFVATPHLLLTKDTESGIKKGSVIFDGILQETMNGRKDNFPTAFILDKY